MINLLGNAQTQTLTINDSTSLYYNMNTKATKFGKKKTSDPLLQSHHDKIYLHRAGQMPVIDTKLISNLTQKLLQQESISQRLADQ